MTLRSAVVLLGALAPALLAGQAQAASTAHASITVLDITLIDNDLNDGITPSLQLLPHWSLPYVDVLYILRSDSNDERGSKVTATSQWESISTQVTQSGGTGTSSVSGSSLDTLKLDSSIETSKGPLFSMRTEGDITLRYLLSANTIMQFTFESDIGASRVAGDSDYASARTENIFAYADDAFPEYWYSHFYSENAGGPSGNGAGSQIRTANMSSGAQSREWSLTSRAYTEINPVPEPQTWGMLLTGLAVAGAAALRRRGRGRPAA